MWFYCLYHRLFTNVERRKEGGGGGKFIKPLDGLTNAPTQSTIDRYLTQVSDKVASALIFPPLYFAFGSSVPVSSTTLTIVSQYLERKRSQLAL